MTTTPTITSDERQHLRELARKYRQYAELPVMEQRRKLWYDHNALRAQRPVVVMENHNFLPDILPPLHCVSPLAQTVETNLLTGIANHELIDDDKVLSPQYMLPLKVGFREFDRDMHLTRAADTHGRQLGWTVEHPLTDLQRDLPALRHSTFWVDRDGTEAERHAIEQAVGDILPVHVKNQSLRWLCPSNVIVRLMGMELMLLEMAEHPELMKALYAFVLADMQAYLRWQEQEGLLTLNNGNDYAGAGSYGFSQELPKEALDGRPAATSGSEWRMPADGRPVPQVRATDLWGNMNSQETVGVSPQMYTELVYPAYEELARCFGLVYYGCCEPVHDLWDCCLHRLPNLRKISVSPWCDEQAIGQRLRGGQVIYSRKPSPNFIGVGSFDETAFTAHIAQTLSAARGCHLEIIFRDIYTLNGDPTRAGRAVRIVRNLIDRL